MYDSPTPDRPYARLTLRYLFGATLLAIGLFALFDFEALGRLFMFLSPDRSVTPFMMQLLRIVLVSLGAVGLAVLFFNFVRRVLDWIDGLVVAPSPGRYVCFALGVGLLLRAAVVLLMPFHLWMDYASYDDLGWQWATKGGYYNGELLTAYWPPAYPFLLSRLYLLFGHVPMTGVAVNFLFSLATAYLAYLIARAVWNERIGRWTLLLLACLPSQILFVNVLASEVLFAPLLLGGIYVALISTGRSRFRWWRPFFCGFLLGLAALTRSIALLCLLPVIYFWLRQSRRLKTGLLLALLGIAGMSVVVVPWMVRNYYVVGSFAINTNTGINLFIGNQPSSGMGYNQHAANEYDVNDPSREAEIDRETTRRAWQYIKEHPWAFARRGVIKVAFFYAVDVDALDYGLLQAAETGQLNASLILAFPTQIYYLLVLYAALVGLATVYVSRRTGRSRALDLLTLTIIYWTAVHFVFYGIGRYHFPIAPILTTLASVCIVDQVERQRRELFTR